MAWELMTQEEVKSVQVGQKIRINGTETEILNIYDREEGDFGFGINNPVKIFSWASKLFMQIADGYHPFTDVVGNSAVIECFNENKFEKEVA
jgi:hypothetical protein